MREMIIKSYEEECGSELYKLYIPNDIKEKDLEKALDMASRYASVLDWYVDEEVANDYELDEHWKEFFKNGNNDINGIERFFGYLEMAYGWESQEITYDYEFEW